VQDEGHRPVDGHPDGRHRQDARPVIAEGADRIGRAPDLADGEPGNPQGQHVGEIVPRVADEGQAVDGESRREFQGDEEAVQQDGPAQAGHPTARIPARVP